MCMDVHACYGGFDAAPISTILPHKKACVLCDCLLGFLNLAIFVHDKTVRALDLTMNSKNSIAKILANRSPREGSTLSLLAYPTTLT